MIFIPKSWVLSGIACLVLAVGTAQAATIPIDFTGTGTFASFALAGELNPIVGTPTSAANPVSGTITINTNA